MLLTIIDGSTKPFTQWIHFKSSDLQGFFLHDFGFPQLNLNFHSAIWSKHINWIYSAASRFNRFFFSSNVSFDDRDWMFHLSNNNFVFANNFLKSFFFSVSDVQQFNQSEHETEGQLILVSFNEHMYHLTRICSALFYIMIEIIRFY